MMTEWCIHAANLFYLGSYLSRDMLWLRVLTCFGMAFGLFFFSTCSTPMFGPAAWHGVFLVINIVQIVLLIQQRRRLGLNDGQRVTRHATLDGMSDEELLISLTRTVCDPEGRVQLVSSSTSLELTPDEIAFRDIAFNRLSRGEIINLLARREWRSLEKLRDEWLA